MISTHSLTRRLTGTVVEYLDGINFNSQPHKEADVGCVEESLLHSVFQLTASQGG